MTVETPVSLFIYKRPNHTAKVLERIEKANPQLLLVVGDGPKNSAEEEKCRKTRELVEDVSSDVEVRTNFAAENLGLRERFVSGLRWVFEQTDEAIILEDDTLPDPSFFSFCDELLEQYRGDNRVWDIAGSNHLGTWKRDGYDYHFSHYGGIWGWATWRESWEEYDPNMELWESETVRDRIRDVLSDDDQYRYAKRVYEDTKTENIDTWDYQWGFSRHRNNGLSVVPSENLVKNIGFDQTATHTTDPSHGFARKETSSLSPPLSHPPFIAPDMEYDREIHNLRNTRSLPKRIVDMLTQKVRD